MTSEPATQAPAAPLRERVTARRVDLPSTPGLSADGSVAAFGQGVLTLNSETIVRSIMSGRVHPDFRGRGIGRQLLAWQEARALQQRSSGRRCSG